MTTGGNPLEKEIVVVGGGPGGLSAALAAAAGGAEKAGSRILLLDAHASPGGQYYHQPPEWRTSDATPRQKKGRDLWQLVQAAGVEIRSAAQVWNIEAGGAEPQFILSVAGPGGGYEVRARAVILAAGTYERPAIFPGWTLPGVITAGAAQMLLYYEALPGKLVLFVGSGPLQLLVADHLLKAGGQAAAVLEAARPGMEVLPLARAMWGQWERLGEGLTALTRLVKNRVPYRPGWGIVAAHGSSAVEGATIARLDANWRPILGTQREIECDTICIGYGFIPFVSLSKLAGVEMEWRMDLGGEIPRRDENRQTSMPGLYAVGDGAGVGGYRLAMLEGQVAGRAAARQVGLLPRQNGKLPLEKQLSREQSFQRLYSALFTPRPGIYELAQPDTLVCRCEGITQARIESAVQSGATTIAEVKAITRCGMGSCQGRMCGQHVMHTIARLTGKPPEEVGVNNIRPPIFPVRLRDLV